MTSAPLLHKDWLLVEVGDDEGNLMAFDKRTGKRLWSSECKDEAGHTGGPVPNILQSNQTDLDFLKELATAYRCEVRVDGGKLRWKKLRRASRSQRL